MSKPAFVRPIHRLVASTARVLEQITRRLLLMHVETLQGGREKSIAAIVDKEKTKPMKSVLVMEAWAPGDQSHVQQGLGVLRIGHQVSVGHEDTGDSGGSR